MAILLLVLTICLLLGVLYLYRFKNTKAPTSGTVHSVALSPTHEFSKKPTDSITLLPGLGVEGDCHCGSTVQHLSRLKIRPIPPNLRQVHLMQSELFTEFKKEGADGKKYDMKPADLGENITTKGLDLLGMGVGTKLHFVNPGKDEREGHAVVCVTGLRNPCPQISKFQKGLQERCLVRGEGRKAGIMSVVEVGGVVMRGATIVVERPGKYIELPCV